MTLKPAFFDHSFQREAQIQRRLLDVMERRFSRQIRDALIEASVPLIEAYAFTGSVPDLGPETERVIRDLYLDMGETAVRTFGARIVGQGKAIGALETKQEDEGGFAAFFRRLAEAWIQGESIRERIVAVTRTTRDRIVSHVVRGQREGLGVDAIASRMTAELPEISRQRAALIARTETHGAANYGANETAKSTGLDLRKRWLAVEDHRTRAISRDDAFDHLAMDGQTQPMDAPFLMPWLYGGGEPLRIMFPGEAGHPGGATINCRCATAHMVEGLDD